MSVCVRASLKLYKSPPALVSGEFSNSAAVHTKEHTRLVHCVLVLVHILHYNKVREKRFTYSLDVTLYVWQQQHRSVATRREIPGMSVVSEL